MCKQRGLRRRKYIPRSSQRNLKLAPKHSSLSATAAGMQKHFLLSAREVLSSTDSSGSSAPVTASPLQTNPNTEVNIIPPQSPGRCQRVGSHCVRTSPAEQRSQPSPFHPKTGCIVIQMCLALASRPRAVPLPSSAAPVLRL